MIGIVLLGPPGVGKGTQAARLKEALALAHLSTGDVLRQAVRDGSPLGERVKAVMESGSLVPDALVGEVVESLLSVLARSAGKPAGTAAAPSGFLLDGFPRTVGQVAILDEVLARTGLTLDHVVLLDAPRDIVLRRLTGRRVCGSCGALYHVDSKKPGKAGTCDACGKPIVQRPDDSEESVARRLTVYQDETAPLAAEYGRRGLLRTVDGSGDPEAVFARLLSAVGGALV